MRIGPIILVIGILASCSVPKVMNQSGRVTPKGTIAGGLTYMANVSQESSILMSDILKKQIENFTNDDTVQYNQILLDANAALVAYAVDPIAFGPQFYLRVGVWDRLEVGYTRAKGANMFRVQGQFLGFEKARSEESTKRWFGSAGLQYSWNSYNLPKFFGKMQDRFGFDYKRRDFLLPVTFSYSLGPNETYGAVGFGAVFGFHHIDYSFLPDRIVNDKGVVLQATDHTNDFSSIGFFVNVKAGYKYIYIIPSIAVYYQQYGTYPLLDRSSVFLEGFTFVPGISLQLNTIRKEKV
ncbi:MAG: hypothetical protein ACYC1Q_03030 [Bacteroidia bacterium]